MKDKTKNRKYGFFSKSRLRFRFIFWNRNRTDFTVNRTSLLALHVHVYIGYEKELDQIRKLIFVTIGIK